MGLKLKNNAVSRLAAGITAGDVSLSITPGDGAKFPSLSAGDYFPCTLIRASDGAIEIVLVTDRSTDVFTITRAQEGTTGLAFVAGDRVELRMTASAALDLPSAAIQDAANKATLTDADEFGVTDSAASNVTKSHTWANLKDGIWAAWGALINGGTSKATPVDADAIALMDSASGNATKKTTWANVKAALKTYFDTLYAIVGAVGSTGITMNTDRLLGRTTASAGAIEEITVGAGISLSAGSLSTTFASAAENAAGTIENKAVDPLGIREALNASGSAPVYAARAWVNFNGTGTVAIRASGNVSSITDNGAGNYTVNFATAMPDTSYSFFGTANGISANSIPCHLGQDSASTKTTSALQVLSSYDNNASIALQDVSQANVSVFR